MSASIFRLGPEGTTAGLCCPRCGANARVAIALAGDLVPVATVTCSRLGTACGGKKLTDVALVPDLAHIQRDINVREIVRRFQQALAVITQLKGSSADPLERLGAAIHAAQTALAGVVPTQSGQSIGSPESSDAAAAIAREVAAAPPPPSAQTPAPPPLPNKITAVRLPELQKHVGSTPIYKLMGYETEDAYYEKEWGGEPCADHGRILDSSGRKHADDGSACAS